ncbi:hypothetical protein [Calothrix sp. 336/3]|uniref:hypothetical protein n=1 Tax=Calothrix sp. 336/3 TaxID=1337936 RepID=UPI0004E2DD34|nr:hypothetical protein [Calothrix sp. 336/3]AKG23247.1 hypothetical protein IJ00_19960 [Calothrix sp. 336/3]
MVAKKPNDKNTKAEILQAYEELAKEKAALKSQLDKAAETITQTSSKEKENIRENIKVEPVINMNQRTSVQQKMNATIDSLMKIQLGFGSAASELSEQLTNQASKLSEIRQSVEQEIQELKQLHNLEISEDTLDSLIASYENNSKTFQEEYTQRYEEILQEFQAKVNSWNQEQEIYKTTIQERNDNLNKSRQRDSAEYKYDLELERKLQKDEYEQEQKLLYKQLDEFRENIEKQWTEREKTISDQEKQFAECKAKVEAFPQEKESAVKKATEEGRGIAHYQAKIKSDLFAKEVEGQKRFYEQRLQSLEQTITNQESRIQNLSKQLESALKQVQDLAVKAIEGTSNVNSYQVMKEIALEQAKSQAKAK